MPTKREMMEAKTKAELLKLARKARIDTVRKSMLKSELVDHLSNSRKIKKADL